MAHPVRGLVTAGLLARMDGIAGRPGPQSSSLVTHVVDTAAQVPGLPALRVVGSATAELTGTVERVVAAPGRVAHSLPLDVTRPGSAPGRPSPAETRPPSESAADRGCADAGSTAAETPLGTERARRTAVNPWTGEVPRRARPAVPGSPDVSGYMPDERVAHQPTARVRKGPPGDPLAPVDPAPGKQGGTALPKPAPDTGSGDITRSWQAFVPGVFVRSRHILPPAPVATAEDPAVSPD